MTKIEKQEEIGMRVDQARIAANVSQREFARALHCSQSNIQQKTAGKVRFNAADLSCAAKLFNVSADWLLGLKDDPRPYRDEGVEDE